MYSAPDAERIRALKQYGDYWHKEAKKKYRSVIAAWCFGFFCAWMLFS